MTAQREAGPADSIIITGIMALGRHGVLESEKADPQRFEVDLEICLDLRVSESSDQLGDTVDYSHVACRTVEIIEKQSFTLLERLAGEIASCVLENSLVDSVTVWVRKPDAPIDISFKDVGVRIVRTRG
ncbi:MAG TPA: dihydroneopterin aldolase [Acidimicrobiales bacterium]|nr:dihydroneopterin aldolase [Acidimicrobiales bacterium]